MLVMETGSREEREEMTVVNFDNETVKQTCRLADWLCDPSRLKDCLTQTNNRAKIWPVMQVSK